MSVVTNLETMAASLSNHFHNTTQQSTSFEDDMIQISNRMMKHLARPLISQMGINGDISRPVALLDGACGSGVVTQEVQNMLPRPLLVQSSFICSDSSAAMVDLVRKRIVNEKWANARAEVLDATNTGLPQDSITHAALALALHVIPDPDAAIKDCIRIIKPGGTFGASTWPKQNADKFWFPDIRTAFKALPFDAPLPDVMPMQIHKSGHWDDADWISGHLPELGLKDVAVNLKEGSYQFQDAAEFVATFGMMLP